MPAQTNVSVSAKLGWIRVHPARLSHEIPLADRAHLTLYRRGMWVVKIMGEVLLVLVAVDILG